MRILVQISTQHILEMQSAATAGTLIANDNGRHPLTDLEERVVDATGYVLALANDPDYQAQLVAQQAAAIEAVTLEAAKQTDITTNLPTWAQVATAIDNATTLTALRTIVKKLARVVYWLAKNSQT